MTAFTSEPSAPTLSTYEDKRMRGGMWREAFRDLKTTRLPFYCGILLFALLIVAIVAPWLAPYSYKAQNYNALSQHPNSTHWLGTDDLGRDILSRLMMGARISMTIGIVVQFVILIFGVPAGMIAGYYGGKIDSAIMRTVDVLYSIPSLLFIIVLLTFIRAKFEVADSGVMGSLASLDGRTGGLLGVFIGVSLINWMPAARLVRAQAISLKEKEFVEAARGSGAGDFRILFQHLLPNQVATIIVTATLGIPGAILYEAGISFLGLGARPPMPSWGLMISEAIPNMRSYPYLLISPAIALSITALAFNFLGDGLRDAIDPWKNR